MEKLDATKDIGSTQKNLVIVVYIKVIIKTKPLNSKWLNLNKSSVIRVQNMCVRRKTGQVCYHLYFYL